MWYQNESGLVNLSKCIYISIKKRNNKYIIIGEVATGRYEEIPVDEFDTEEQAQDFLDNLVDFLNSKGI